MCSECFRHALTVNQLAYFVGMQSRLTAWAVSSRDAEQQRLAREEERRQLREGQAAAAAAVSLPWPRADEITGMLSSTAQLSGEMLSADVTDEPPPWWAAWNASGADEGEDISGEHKVADELEEDEDEALLLIDEPDDEKDPPPVEADAPLAEPAPAEPAASTSGWCMHGAPHDTTAPVWPPTTELRSTF